MYTLTWSEIKKIADENIRNIEFIEQERVYLLSIHNNGIQFFSQINKTETKNSDQIDFEDNYKGTKKKLLLTDNIIPLREGYETYIPPSGKKLIITKFNAEAPYSLNSACKVIWDFGGENETVIWNTKGSGEMPFNYLIPASDTDGIKKLAITGDNGESISLLMSIYLEFTEI